MIASTVTSDLCLGSPPRTLRPTSTPGADRFGAALACSDSMRALFERLRRLCRSDVTVLLEGETGTGKELLARALHDHSARRDQPFIVVDCGAISPGLVGSELFGHVRGAFTGAASDRAGAFEAADGGTLMLDEVGELDLTLQTHLLRALERGEVKRLGDAHHRQVNVRVVAATNRDLQQAVRAGTFRADLYYRLAVVDLRVPPLRERPDDIALLVRTLLPEIARRLGVQAPSLRPERLRQLMAHPWPGNVRQLRNYLERSVALCGGTIGADPSSTLRLDDTRGAPSIEELARLPFKEAKARWIAHFDAEYVRRVLHACEGNVAEAGRRSGVDRVHLFRLIKKYGLRAAHAAARIRPPFARDARP